MNQRIAKDGRGRGDAASNHIFNDLHINHNIYPWAVPLAVSQTVWRDGCLRELRS